MSAREVPASFGQRLVWLMGRHRGRSGDLNERLAWHVRGPLDPRVLSAALDALVRRHEALRTTFRGSIRSLNQVINEAAPVPLEVGQLAGRPGAEALAELVAHAAEEPLDPLSSPLRARLWRIDDREHVLLLVVHQLVTDLWSNAILAAELAALYDHCAGAGTGELPSIEWQYADWSEWQHARLEGDSGRALKEYWRSALAGTQFPPLGAPAAGGSPGAKGFVRRRLEADVADAIARTAAQTGSTPFAVALAAFHLHLHRATGVRHLAIASLFANRAQPEVARTVGLFANMIVLAGRVDPDARFGDLVADTEAGATAAAAHQEMPFQLLPPDLVRAETGRAEDVVFQFTDGEPRASSHARIHGLELTPIERQGRRSRFAVELFVAWLQTGVEPVLVYDTRRFGRAWAVAFADGYADLLRAGSAAPDAPIRELVADDRAFALRTAGPASA